MNRFFGKNLPGIWLRISVLIMLACSGNHNAKERTVPQSFNPQWKVNQQWKLKMAVPGVEQPKIESPVKPLVIRELIFRVVRLPDRDNPGTVIFVRDSEAEEDYGFHLYLRQDPLSLQKVVQVAAAKETEIILKNGKQLHYTPFTASMELFWDFPLFPLTSGENQKTGCMVEEAEVLQTVKFENNEVTLDWVLPGEIDTFGENQRWQPGRPWYVKLERFMIEADGKTKTVYSWAELIQ